MLFHPAATVLIFSRRDEEAIDLLKVRLRGCYDHLPAWLKVRARSEPMSPRRRCRTTGPMDPQRCSADPRSGRRAGRFGR
jgi:hypothetical protein